VKRRGKYRGANGSENELSNRLNAGTPDIAAIHGDKHVAALHLGLELVWEREAHVIGRRVRASCGTM